MTLRPAYNTNGFPQHRLDDVVELLAEMGYAGIAVTPDVHHLDPFAPDAVRRATALRARLEDLGLAVAVETGARFVLDRARKHQPTLLSAPAGAAERLDLLVRCHGLAVALGAETLSFWSGAPGEGDRRATDDELLDRLCAGSSALLDEARGSGVRLCVEPEPGMLVDSLAATDAFLLRLGREELSVMLDVGHVPVTERIAAHEAVLRLGPRLGGVQLDDARPGVHEHLFPGEGVTDWPALVSALDRARYVGLAALELPRHVHDPVRTAREALDFLRRLEPEPAPGQPPV
ncbi:MAG: sugar phosphate isomerase/epimerase family protein [Planctomycetota bacterium]